MAQATNQRRHGSRRDVLCSQRWHIFVRCRSRVPARYGQSYVRMTAQRHKLYKRHKGVEWTGCALNLNFCELTQYLNCSMMRQRQTWRWSWAPSSAQSRRILCEYFWRSVLLDLIMFSHMSCDISFNWCIYTWPQVDRSNVDVTCHVCFCSTQLPSGTCYFE